MRWMRALVVSTGLAGLTLMAAAGEGPEPGGDKDPAPTPGQESPEERSRRIGRLIKDLGADDFETRDAATKALLAIGLPAKAALEEAAKDADAERATRAGEVLQELIRPTTSRMGGHQIEAKPTADRTDGWMAVGKGSVHCQSFKATADMEVTKLRIRAARTLKMPGVLTVELREADAAADAAPAAKVEMSATWKEDTGKERTLTRYLTWVEAELPAKLGKDKVYRLVFRSEESEESAPWMLSCFYRDTYPGGEHSKLVDGQPKPLGKFDLAVELVGKNDAKLSTLPAGEKLDKKELWGPGHDGKEPPAASDLERLRTDFL